MRLPSASLPSADAGVEVWEETLLKKIVEVIFDPRALVALQEGLTAPDLRERRAWWSLLLPQVIGRPPGDDDGSGRVTIILGQGVAAPVSEEGPLATPGALPGPPRAKPGEGT